MFDVRKFLQATKILCLCFAGQKSPATVDKYVPNKCKDLDYGSMKKMKNVFQ